MFPSYAGRCYPIIVAPKGQGGDRIVVGALAIGDDDQIAAAPFLGDGKCANVNLSALGGLQNIGTLLCTHVLAHLRAGSELSSWKPPLEAVSIGSSLRASGADVWGIVDLGLAQFSALHAAVKREQHAREQQAVRNSISDAGIHLSKRLQRLAATRHPKLEAHFLRYVPMYVDSRPLRVDFLGRNGAFYFSRHTIGSSIASFVVSSKAKLFSLQELREWASDDKRDLGGAIRMKYELAIAPDQSRANAAQLDEFEHALEELATSANRLGLRVRSYESEEDLVDEVADAEPS